MNLALKPVTKPGQSESYDRIQISIQKDMPTFGQLSVFDGIYTEEYWGGGSGGGSTPAASKPYVLFLESFLRKNNIKSIVDLGCGDWQFTRHLDLSGIHYTGIDAAKSIVEVNSLSYGSSNIHFSHFTGDYSIVPKADLLLCKDVLQHLDTASVHEVVKSVIPLFRFSLVTNDVPNRSLIGKLVDKIKGRDPFTLHGLNREIQIGDYRLLDLRFPPFSLDASVALEWKVNPWRFVKRVMHPRTTVLGGDCEWRKRTLLIDRSTMETEN
jgi:SAM-dependent methyltransferase